MTRIDFYILANGNREQFACRLAEKAYQQGHKVVLYTADEQQSRRIDDMLWTFRPGSFVPHSQGQLIDSKAPVNIMSQIPADISSEDSDVLINLSNNMPLSVDRFNRLAEVVDSNSETRQQGRERFRTYRQQGFEIMSHDIA